MSDVHWFTTMQNVDDNALLYYTQILDILKIQCYDWLESSGIVTMLPTWLINLRC